MRDSLLRVAAAGLLCLVFVGVMAHYGATAPDHDQLRESLAKLDSPGDHLGEDVYLWVTVENGGDPFVGRAGGQSVTVTGAGATVQPGDSVQVAGTITAPGRIAADRTVVSDRGNLTGLYAVSAVALGLVAVVFGRSWTVDPGSLSLVPREDDDA